MCGIFQFFWQVPLRPILHHNVQLYIYIRQKLSEYIDFRSMDFDFFSVDLTHSDEHTNIEISIKKNCIRGHSQMTSQHWTTNGNLKSWWKLTRRDHGLSEKMINDEKSNDLWESIQKRP